MAEAQTRDMRGIVHEVPLHQIGDADDAEVALSSRREVHRRTHCGQCSEPYLSGSPRTTSASRLGSRYTTVVVRLVHDTSLEIRG